MLLKLEAAALLGVILFNFAVALASMVGAK